MVYLAGYGVQLAGENYFIPVDSTIEHDTDIPIEGMRISDYIRQLAALPLKASVIVLDAARQQPFIEGGQPIAERPCAGRAGNEYADRLQCRARHGRAQRGRTYGAYAQSLAEMIRTGGLSLPDVFDRVRLRVNEASKGAQVPWDAQKIQAQFSFFDRRQRRAADARHGGPGRAIRDRPIRDLSVQDAYTAALERDTLQGYQDFLAAFPSDPVGQSSAGDRRRAARGDHMAPHLSGRHAGRLLVLSAALSARAACLGCPPPSDHPDRAAGPAAVIRHARL